MQGNVIKKDVPECCPVLIDDTQDLEKCEDTTPDAIKKCEGGIPNIRFQGFSDDWEQRKVGDLLIERNQQAPMSDEYPLMAFIANEGVAPKGERYDRSALVTDTVNKLYKKTEKGDFIYSSNNLETGSIGLNKYGKACISPVYSIFEPTGIADSDFLGRRLVRKDFINAMVKWRQGVIYGQWRIHESDFLRIEITVPSVEEQRKIGTYLDQLDHLITLHQRKCDETKELKKYMLQKMFPKDGEKVPEIRFQGFTGEWECRKLGGLLVEYNEKAEKGGIYEHVSLTTEGVVPKSERYERDQLVKHDDKKYRITHRNDICYNPANLKFGVICRNKYKEGIFSPIYVTFKTKKDCSAAFMERIVTRASFIKKALLYQQGTVYERMSVSPKDLLNLDVYVPCLEEQDLIGKYFDYLDRLITLYQRKCDKLKEIKRYMLQNMFPQKI